MSILCIDQVGDSALYLGLLSLFVNELAGNCLNFIFVFIGCYFGLTQDFVFPADMQFSFFLFSGYVGVSLLSPIMHNLWIWRVCVSYLSQSYTLYLFIVIHIKKYMVDLKLIS